MVAWVGDVVLSYYPCLIRSCNPGLPWELISIIWRKGNTAKRNTTIAALRVWNLSDLWHQLFAGWIALYSQWINHYLHIGHQRKSSEFLSLLLFRVHQGELLFLLFWFEGYFIGFLFHSSHLQNPEKKGKMKYLKLLQLASIWTTLSVFWRFEYRGERKYTAWV